MAVYAIGSQVGTGTRRNYAVDPSFDGAAWTEWYGAASTFTYSTAQALTGTKSGKIVVGGGFATALAASGITPAAVQHTVKLSMRTDAGGAYAIRVGDAASNWVVAGTAQTVAANTWTAMSALTFTPGNTNELMIGVYGTGAVDGATVYLDNVLLERGATSGSFFPTPAQLASGEASWLGSANASASEKVPYAVGIPAPNGDAIANAIA